MNLLLEQLRHWRRTERLIRAVWGGARLVAILGTVLALACFADWTADRYLGSETWRRVLNATWVFAPTAPTAEERWFSDHMRLAHGFRPPPAAVIDDTPGWMHAGMTVGQLALALGLAYWLLVRPWLRTPPIDDLAQHAEKEIPAFGHRLVTAIQLNRPAARTQGMSPALIAAVTREAGQLAAAHNLLQLVDYRRLGFALLVASPVLIGWTVFGLAKPALAGVLLRRQLLVSAEIPRSIQLKNVSEEVWPIGAEVEVRYEVTGAYPRPWFTDRLRAEHGFALPPPTAGFSGRLRVEPDGQPAEAYNLVYEKEVPDKPGAAYFVTKLPPSSINFGFSARLDSGRTRETGRVRFEGRPQLSPDGDALTAELWLPKFLGTQPDGGPFVRRTDGWVRGDVSDALPLAQIRVDAKFNKPVRSARLVPILREGARERDFAPSAGDNFQLPRDIDSDRRSAVWLFPTNEKLIGYRIELTDDRGFTNEVPIRRTVRMLEDRPPAVVLLPESTRHPDPENYHGASTAKLAHEWGDRFPLAEGGRVMVVYSARSEQGVGRAAVAYRVIPKGVAPDAMPPEWQQVQHPRQDWNWPENKKVFKRLPLKPVIANLAAVGNYVPDLGLFEKSWQGLSKFDQFKVNVEFYSLPSPNPEAEPAGLEAGGRYMFEIDGLQKTVPDGSGGFTTAKLEVGDTVELYVEAFDKNPTPGRAPGHSQEARRKIVVTGEEAGVAIKMRDEQNRQLQLQDKLRELATDQADLFRQTTNAPKEPEKK
ncbi:FUSC family protein [Gemmata sp. JC717]|uniref:FUSC family protein n=1 Tax=Gemmata algarum TaxID=2975278 RepID=UPI0021BB353F|nr:FUSC family protein [Gemmata algarum]MDY3554618.1 FUSC family protein [Gemmata algarum]